MRSRCISVESRADAETAVKQLRISEQMTFMTNLHGLRVGSFDLPTRSRYLDAMKKVDRPMTTGHSLGKRTPRQQPAAKLPPASTRGRKSMVSPHPAVPLQIKANIQVWVRAD